MYWCHVRRRWWRHHRPLAPPAVKRLDPREAVIAATSVKDKELAQTLLGLMQSTFIDDFDHWRNPTLVLQNILVDFTNKVTRLIGFVAYSGFLCRVSESVVKCDEKALRDAVKLLQFAYGYSEGEAISLVNMLQGFAYTLAPATHFMAGARVKLYSLDPEAAPSARAGAVIAPAQANPLISVQDTGGNTVYADVDPRSGDLILAERARGGQAKKLGVAGKVRAGEWVTALLVLRGAPRRAWLVTLNDDGSVRAVASGNVSVMELPGRLRGFITPFAVVRGKVRAGELDYMILSALTPQTSSGTTLGGGTIHKA